MLIKVFAIFISKQKILAEAAGTQVEQKSHVHKHQVPSIKQCKCQVLVIVG